MKILDIKKANQRCDEYLADITRELCDFFQKERPELIERYSLAYFSPDYSKTIQSGFQLHLLAEAVEEEGKHSELPKAINLALRKYHAIQQLKKTLHKELSSPSQPSHDFQQDLKAVQVILSTHRDTDEKRFFKNSANLLSCGLFKKKLFAIKSKMLFKELVALLAPSEQAPVKAPSP